MNAPVSLDKLASETDAFLTDRIELSQRRMRRALAALEARIINLHARIKTDDAGNIRGPHWTLTQAQEMHAKTAALFEELYGNAAHLTVQEFQRVAKRVVDDLGRLDVPVEFNNTTKRTVKALQEQSYQAYHTLGLEAQNRIASAVYGAIVAGSDVATVTRQIQGAIRGHKDVRGRPLSVYTETYTQDAIMGAYRSLHIATAEQAGLTDYLYTGTIIKGSREWCQRHVGKVYSREEIEAMDAQTWDGKSGPPITNCGGYNCRHHWQGVRREWVEQAKAS